MIYIYKLDIDYLIYDIQINLSIHIDYHLV